MKRRHKQNDVVDKTGEKVLKAIRMRESDIEYIIASPDLFEPVRSAIKARQTGPEKGYTTFWMALNGRRWQTAVAIAAIFVAGVVAVTYLVRQVDRMAETIADSRSQSLRADPSPTSTNDPLIDVSQANDLDGKANSVEQQSQRRIAKPLKPHVAKRHLRSEPEEIGEFQMLTYTGDPTDAEHSSQIVRVELPRSSLFAMGIDIPVENQSNTKIKADLLIGEDGVMRAVRVIN
jgi:hypothetical protein